MHCVILHYVYTSKAFILGDVTYGLPALSWHNKHMQDVRGGVTVHGDLIHAVFCVTWPDARGGPSPVRLPPSNHQLQVGILF